MKNTLFYSRETADLLTFPRKMAEAKITIKGNPFLSRYEYWIIRLAGADMDIVRRLPKKDRQPYRWIGMLHVLIFCFCVISALVAAGQIFRPATVYLWMILIAILGFVSLGLQLGSRQLIKKISYESGLIFLSIGIIINTFLALTFLLNNSNNRRIANFPDIAYTRASLADDTSAIREQYITFRNQLRSTKYDTGTILNPDVTAAEDLRLYDDFLSIAMNKMRQWPLPDTNDLHISIYRAGQTVSLIKRAVSTARIRTWGDWSDAQMYLYDTTRLNLAAIVSSMDGHRFDTLSTTAKIGFLLSTSANETGIVQFCLVFFLMIIPFSLIYSTIKSSQRDFYHTLLEEKHKQETEGLLTERARIAEEFRLQSEISNRQSILGELKDPRPLPIPVNTSTKSPPALQDLTPDIVFTNARHLFENADYPRALEYINKAIELDERELNTDPHYFLHPEYYELKGKILQASSDPTGSKAALDRFEELDNDNKYRINLTKDVIIDRIRINNLPFLGSFEWRLTPGMNILLGKNGYGKSHLLRLIIAILYCDKAKIRDWIPNNAPFDCWVKAYVSSDHPIRQEVIDRLKKEMDTLYTRRDTKSEPPDQNSQIKREIDALAEQIDAEQRRIMADKEKIVGKIGRVPILAIPDSRFITRSEPAISNTKGSSEDLKHDGATEFLYGRPFGPIISKSLFTIAQKNRSDFTKEPYRLIQRILSELAEPGPLTTPKQPGTGETPDAGESSKTFFEFTRIETVSTTGDFKFFVRSEENQQEVQLQSISQGTFSILSVCLLIYRFLSELRPAGTDPLKEKAIVLIDEIDAHLHPSWEQKVIGLLRREFPNVQFIITAHSPLIVAGCLEDEVNIIRHSANGFSLEQPMGNFIGYSTPELFKEIFEIEDRDYQYLHYAGISSQESQFQIRVREFEEEKDLHGLSPAQLGELDELYKNLNYIHKVNHVQEQEADVSTLQTQNKALKKELDYLRTQLDTLRQPPPDITL